MFESFKSAKQRLQLHIGDDGVMEFRRLPVLESSLVEKGTNDQIIRAWPLFHKLTVNFSGFKGIKRDKVSICCDRDIILDPFDLLSPSEKPEKGNKLAKDWIRKKAEAVRYKHQRKGGVNWMGNAIIYILGAALILELLMLGLKIALSSGG